MSEMFRNYSNKHKWIIWSDGNDKPRDKAYEALEYANNNPGSTYSILCLHSVAQCRKAEVIQWDEPEDVPPSDADHIRARIADLQRQWGKCEHWECLKANTIKSEIAVLERKLAEMGLKTCPFCGENPVVNESGLYQCMNVDCPIAFRQMLIGQWNTRADDWQPIETAPKDGTVVDLWDDEDKERHTNCAWLEDFEVDHRWFDEFWG